MSSPANVPAAPITVPVPASSASSAAPDSAAAASAAPAEDDEPSDAMDLTSLMSHPPTPASSYSSFSVLPRPSAAHHFLSSHPSPSTSSVFLRKARSEQSLLSAHLPAGIHVLTYEARLDLLRCVICGPERTPYYQSLFLFDVCLPSSYPAVPPVLHYHARGLRLNPNLYAEGKGRTTLPRPPSSLLHPFFQCFLTSFFSSLSVCLSLLNTWSGRSSERWNPDSSTLLQVLLSLQGLVLGDEEPFYLEAGSVTRGLTAVLPSSRR